MEVKTGKKVIDIEIKALELLKKDISSDFSKVISILINCKGKIVISGMGINQLIYFNVLLLLIF